MSEQQKRYWIGVASRDHVASAIELGIAQFCHGKVAPARRLRKGDLLIYYSPKVTMGGVELYQKFTAIGIVDDEMPYQVDMGGGFKPFRRNIKYFNSLPADIRPLINDLPFIKNKKSWGVIFRYGLIAVDIESFQIIARAMLPEEILS
jgi:hypothetical protein